MPVVFDWDLLKGKSNLAKHGVSFSEARTVFNDPLARVFDDEEQSEDETREIIVGCSEWSHLLFVSFTERGSNHIRIISARKVTRRERKNHEEGIDS